MSALCARATLAAIALLFCPISAAHAQSPPVAPPASTQVQGHAGHGSARDESNPATTAADHAAHRNATEQKEYPAGIPPISDEDRAAAFPQLNSQHTVHDDGIHYYVLFNQLEWQGGDGSSTGAWDTNGWIGRDVNRLWFRTEGEAEEGDLGETQAHVLFGRAIHRWWDLVGGVRHDFGPGPNRTWAAVGIQGLAPYWFEVEATAYLGASGRTHFRVETEYELLLTNRMVLQPLVEFEIYGKSDPERGMGSGLSSGEGGLRLRYELRRELAPYIGVTWRRKFFGTADLAEAAGEDAGAAKLALGVRVWF